MTIHSSATSAPILVGSTWARSTASPAGKKPHLRIVEVIERPTLSRPATVKIVRNDRHPHRAGKVTVITAAKLRRDYEAVA